MLSNRKRKKTSSVKAISIESYWLPENVACYKLMNGSKVFYQQGEPNSIFLECSTKIADEFLPPLPLNFAGEVNNALYFYTIRKTSGASKEKDYTFFKCTYDATSSTSPLDLREIGKLITENNIKFALQQPYYIQFASNIASIMNFEGESELKLTLKNSEMLDAEVFNFFKWRGPAIIVKSSNRGNKTEVMQDTFFDKQLYVISVHHELPSPTSVYAQEDSLLYLLCGTTLFVFKEKLEFSIHTIGDQNCHIGGVSAPDMHRLFLNAPSRFFSHDLPQEIIQEHRPMPIKKSRIPDEDEQLLQTLQTLKESIEKGTVMKNTPSANYSSRFAKEYTIKEILGIGYFGCVFRAVNSYDDHEYAVKRIAVDPKMLEIAKKEVRVMAKLDHPGIVRYNCTWSEEPPADWQSAEDFEMLKRIKSNKFEIMKYRSNSVFFYIKMQLCKYSLTTWLSTHSKVESRSLCIVQPMFKQIVEGVDYLHSMGLIHRDLKPCNILFSENDAIKICDFGLAIERNFENDEEKSQSCSRAYTDAYKSPEQRGALPRLNAKSDVFTLGLIFVELCVIMESYEKKKKIFDNYRDGLPNKIFDKDKATDDFLARLTNKDAKSRPCCQDILNDLYLS